MTDRLDRVLRQIEIRSGPMMSGGQALKVTPLVLANAVLAALADDLMPDVFDTVSALYAERIGDVWKCTTYDDQPESYSGPGYRVTVNEGTGSTIPAAIRNALEGATDE